MSRNHIELSWDGSRWSSVNVSDKTGLLRVYEPGYEEVPLEPRRPWVPVRHRWSYSVGRPEHPFHILCVTDDHRGPPAPLLPHPETDGTESPEETEDEPTAALDELVALRLTRLELDVLQAYYSSFAMLPRPRTLEPRSHDEAARRLGRSRDSTRKAIERINDKIMRYPDAPPAATGRNVSGEVGRWLARIGVLDPDLGGPAAT